MKFQITRASQRYLDDTAPCDGCTKEFRPFKPMFGPEYGLGFWTREFNTLEDITTFMKEVGHGIAIYPSFQWPDLLEIRIVDDYED